MSSPSSSRWDLSQSPLLFAGTDGHVYETRPTASLARDLAESFDDDSEPLAKVASFDALRNKSRNSGAASPRVANRSTPSWSPPSCTKEADERPIRPMPGHSGGGSPARPGGSSPSAVSSARPRFGSLGGAGSLGGNGSSSPSSSSGVAATSARRRSYQGGAGPVASSGYGAVSSGPTRSVHVERPAPQRHAPRAYEPIAVLLGMGFDEASARVAIAAAGGNVDRAARIMLEDAKAHDARTACEWEFEGDSGWAPFDAGTEAIIRNAHSQGMSAVEVNSSGRYYLIDFDSLTQLNLASQRSRRIRRKHDAATASSSSSAAPAMASPAWGSSASNASAVTGRQHDAVTASSSSSAAPAMASPAWGSSASNAYLRNLDSPVTAQQPTPPRPQERVRPVRGGAGHLPLAATAGSGNELGDAANPAASEPASGGSSKEAAISRSAEEAAALLAVARASSKMAAASVPAVAALFPK